MKRARLVAFALMILMVVGGATAQTITVGSWRTDDVAQWKGLIADFNKAYPGIEVRFDPTNPPDYNATLRLQLESGTGPDVFYARSGDVGKSLFKDGYMLDLSAEPFMAKFDAASKFFWQSDDGKSFGMPLFAISQGIYYNKKIFSDNKIAIPKTWEELLAAAKKLSDKRITPFANGTKDEWDINEVLFQTLAPTYVGGVDGRKALESGAKKWNDASVEAAFKAVSDLAPYLPRGFAAVDYNSSKVMFQLGKAAMMFDGSWTIPEHMKAKGLEFDVFAAPAPKGMKRYQVFHADTGMAINPRSKNVAAAKTFLAWLVSDEGIASVGNNFTGFFPIAKASKAIPFSNPAVKSFLSLNEGVGTDVRFSWTRLNVGSPSGYDLITASTIAVLSGKKTPRQAADDFAAGVAKWYKY